MFERELYYRKRINIFISRSIKNKYGKFFIEIKSLQAQLKIEAQNITIFPASPPMMFI